MKQSSILACTATLLGMLLVASCTNTKKVIYLNDLTAADSTALKQAQHVFENRIQKNDQLWITVGGSNPIDLTAINSAAGAANMNIGALGGSILGYFVESDGCIKIPYVGKVKAEGLSRIELEKKLTEIFSEYTKNPVVNVRFLNYYFYVLGEVFQPGRVNMINERTTILEAITQAGDITALGRRDNLLVIREENGVRTFGRVSVLSKDLFKSPYYYLRNNDVVYVEPLKAKFISRQGVPQYITLTSTALALILTIINLTK